ncbi:MAG: Asp-tRNA(Asn)/Glu-tRNA(Gln) amidotransferase subunit GatC, partial [Elusimicrobia bacterium]|nr:Asp-tRNA(Asn)/Glu-tRNA(Gln) amidotransferase subunit GatC [Elusimicrobiota bacterium]
MAITRKDVEHVARLGRVALTEEEKENFTQQLGKILDHVEKLRSLDTSRIEPTSHPFFSKTVWRKDSAATFEDKDLILKNA